MSGILVIEDDPSVQRLVSLVLRSEGYEVRTARDGFDGLRQVKQDEPDLILLDLAMPNMDGRTFVQAARRLELRSRVIILSAYGAANAVDELHADGAVGKPFDPDDLVREVRRFLPGARPPGASRGGPPDAPGPTVYRN